MVLPPPNPDPSEGAAAGIVPLKDAVVTGVVLLLPNENADLVDPEVVDGLPNPPNTVSATRVAAYASAAASLLD